MSRIGETLPTTTGAWCAAGLGAASLVLGGCGGLGSAERQGEGVKTPPPAATTGMGTHHATPAPSPSGAKAVSITFNDQGVHNAIHIYPVEADGSVGDHPVPDAGYRGRDVVPGICETRDRFVSTVAGETNRTTDIWYKFVGARVGNEVEFYATRAYADASGPLPPCPRS